MPLFFLVDSLWALGPARQTLRDKMTSTHVVREVRGARRVWAGVLAGTAGLALWIAVTASVDPAREEAPDFSGLDRSVFVDGCVDEGGTETECHCMFEHISEHVPYEQYSEADRESDPDKWPARVRDVTAAAVNRCTDG